MTALSRPSRGDYDITGDVQLVIEYKKKELLIHVKRARGLASSNTGSTFPDAYIKTYLLPDKSKHSKRKTDVKRKTANPVYKEILKVCGTILHNWLSFHVAISVLYNLQYVYMCV